MIAVIFEVLPNERRKQEYLDIAADLRPLLDEIDGFIRDYGMTERDEAPVDSRAVHG